LTDIVGLGQALSCLLLLATFPTQAPVMHAFGVTVLTHQNTVLGPESTQSL
jgi:hypothetical protein